MPGRIPYRELDRRIWLLAGARAINTMGLSLVMAFMAIYMVHQRDLSAQTYGWVFLGANLCQSFAQGYAGELSDRIGRKRLLMGALLLRSVVIAALGFLVLEDASLWFIVPVLAISAGLRGAFEPVAYAVVADVTAPAHRVAAFGLQRMGTNFGWAIGPAIGGALALVVPYGVVFFCAAPTLCIAAYLVSRIDEPVRSGAPATTERVSLGVALRDAIGRLDATLILLCAFVFSVCHMQLFSTLSLFTSGELGMSEGDLGLIYTLNGVGVVAMQLPAIALIDRSGNRAALILGAVIYIAAFVAIGAADSWWHLAGAVWILTAGEVMLAPAQQAVVAEIGDPARMGRAFGLLGFLSMLGFSVGPIIGGAVFDSCRGQPLAMWSTLAVIPALLAAGYLIFAALPRPAAVPHSQS